jgi:glycosyltransferase involved in cell wall biosynthesis
MSAPRVNVTLPVLNEEAQLARSVSRLASVLANLPQWRWEIVIADNGSTDRTWPVASELAATPCAVPIRAMRLEEAGRGRALKRAWLESQADVASYMDIDLATDLECLPPLIAAVTEGGYDLAVGSRRLPGSITTRSVKREVISRLYIGLTRAFLGTHFSDAQCGFKAIRREAAQRLLPLVQDNGWFFDTELLFCAERLGYRILELPVKWVEGGDSRVKVLATALADLRGLARIKREWKMENGEWRTKNRSGER